MFYNKTVEVIEKELDTNINGLSCEEAIKRLNKYGANTLPKKKQDSVLKIFLNAIVNTISLKQPDIILHFAIFDYLCYNIFINSIGGIRLCLPLSIILKCRLI